MKRTALVLCLLVAGRLYADEPATIVLSLEAPKGSVVKSVAAQVYLQGKANNVEDGPLPSATCIAVDARWRCTVPADVPFDLRVDVPGFASLYYWDVSAPAGALRELEPQALLPGATITGWVTDTRDRPIADARVSVFVREATSRDRTHAAARLKTARTNRRGLFQIGGLGPGSYRLVSEAAGLSAAILPEIPIPSAEPVTLPRPIRHAPFAELQVLLDPPIDARGRPWTVQAETAPLYPGRPPQRVTHRAGEDGRWTAGRLRADIHEVTVLDHAGTIVQRASIDLLDGGPGTLSLIIRRVAVRGVVRAGDEPIEAQVHLSHPTSGLVTVTTDADGRFDVSLPSAGRWKPTVLYPPGRTAARIEADPFEIPADLAPEATFEAVVQLPGGRIHGAVVGSDGRKGPAVVHALRGHDMAAQQATDEAGRFSFIGLSPGTYHLDAQSAAGTTPEPVPVVVEDGESREVELVTEPYARLAGFVVTPDGRPASGAVIKYSTDGELWSRMITDVRGHFEAEVSGGSRQVRMIVLTYAYPAALLAAPLSAEPIHIRLRNDGGVLRFRTPAVLSGRGVVTPAHVFRFDTTAPFNGRVYVESGTYNVCRTMAIDRGCRSVTVNPASDQEIDLDAEAEAEEGGAR